MPTLFAENLTKAEREAISIDDFADPDNRKYPIRSQRELDAAARLIGRAPASKQAAIKARAIRIAKRKGLSLPDSWKASMSATFAAADLNDSQVRDLLAAALAEAAEGEGNRCVIQDVNRAQGTFTYREYDPESYGYQDELYQATFEIGDDYTVTLGEGQEVIQTSRYEPAPRDEEDAAGMSRTVHLAYFALGERATAEGAYVVRRGKVSETGSYPDKNIAFSSDDFDAAVSDFAPVPMDSEHEASLFDGALGTLRRVWRQGKELWGEIAVPKELDALFTKNGIARRVSLTWDRATKRIIGCAWAKYPRVSDAAVFSSVRDNLPTTAAERGKRSVTMSFMDKLKALFKAEGIDIDSEAPDPGASSASDARFSALEKQIADLTAALTGQKPAEKPLTMPADARAAFSDETIARKAKEFATEAIRRRRATPGERAGLEAAFTGAMQADLTAARFNDAGALEFPTVKAFTEAVAARAPHRLTDDLLPDLLDGSDVALFAFGNGFDPDSEEASERREQEAPGSRARRAEFARGGKPERVDVNPASVYAGINAAVKNGKGG
jgi:hypothetical protein